MSHNCAGTITCAEVRAFRGRLKRKENFRSRPHPPEPLVIELQTWLREQHARVSKYSETDKAIVLVSYAVGKITEIRPQARHPLRDGHASQQMRGAATDMFPPRLGRALGYVALGSMLGIG
jgi:hypothetical protein